ncbi:uncharacterized protein LOC113506801 isoform X2 [Trichoplusia ni]|uniref:Uncharacterized protein LOC113506801 isoform X2 n=1 Tax=Trichoplusia ni TaxID=7111 RepID=A0A7E5WY86_TRINI|nr:uncharacterized protein LOC113506801 isoform X2 [Trichoplusia ni]
MTSWVIHLLLLPLQINLFVYNRSKNDFAGTAQKVEKKKKFIIVPMLVSFWTHLCLSQVAWSVLQDGRKGGWISVVVAAITSDSAGGRTLDNGCDFQMRASILSLQIKT